MILADWLAAKPFGLAMSSGFFSFFAHTGMMSALIERGLRPSRVAGSSAGALVGGAWAAGLEPDQLADTLLQIQRDDFWDPAPGFGLLRGKLFDRLLRDMLPVDRLERGRVPIQISVFDIVRRRTEVLRAGDLPTAIRASCAVPGLFHPVWIGRKPYWDGGILDRPGIAGIAEGERLLFHHIAARSPLRAADLLPPRRREMTTLVIDDLPRSGPTKLDAGRRALALAREATRRALDLPIADGVVQIASRETHAPHA